MMNCAGKEEQQYFQLAPDTVYLLAESVGISGLSPSVARALAEDASFRCREVANVCGQLLRHGKRKRLTTRDVDRALRWIKADPVFGHGSGSIPASFHKVCDSSRVAANGGSLDAGNCNMYVPEVKLVELLPYALSQGPLIQTPRISVQASWINLEGYTLPDVADPDRFTGDSAQAGVVSPAVIQYYSSVVNVILGSSSHAIQVILDDLRSNSKLGAVMPFLVTFTRNVMKRHSDNYALVQRLLWLLQALFANPFLNLTPKPYLSHLVTALMSSLIINRQNKEQRHDWDCLSGHVRHVPFASQMLNQVLSRWSTPVNQLRAQTLRALKECLREDNSYLSQFGAINAMIVLGPSVLKECLLPTMAGYLTNLEEKMSLIESSQEPLKSRELNKKVLHLLHGTLLDAARAILRSRNSHAHYRMLVEYFGDAIHTLPVPRTAAVQRSSTVKVEAARLQLRKLRWWPSGPFQPSPDLSDSISKMDTDLGSIDYFSNSSRQDFILLADMGLPSDIFASDEQRVVKTKRRTRLEYSDSPVKVCSSVHRHFDVQHPMTVNKAPTINFRLNTHSWAATRLKQRRLLTPRADMGCRTRAIIGKRIGACSSFRSRQGNHLLNHSYLGHVL